MKRSLLASILGITFSVAGVASAEQGIVLFDNYLHRVFDSYNQVKYGTSPPSGYAAGNLVNDSGVAVGLYAGKGVLTDSSALTLIGATMIDPTYTDSGGGWYRNAYISIPTSMWTGSETLTFQVRGWETAGAYAGGGTYGTSLLEGASGLWQEYPASIGPTGSIWIISMPPNSMYYGPLPLVLNVVPEPSAFAVAGLGAATLLIFRRRKQAAGCGEFAETCGWTP